MCDVIGAEAARCQSECRKMATRSATGIGGKRLPLKSKSLPDGMPSVDRDRRRMLTSEPSMSYQHTLRPKWYRSCQAMGDESCLESFEGWLGSMDSRTDPVPETQQGGLIRSSLTFRGGI